MEEKKGFNRAEPQTENGKKDVLFKVGIIIVSLVLATLTAIVINI